MFQFLAKLFGYKLAPIQVAPVTLEVSYSSVALDKTAQELIKLNGELREKLNDYANMFQLCRETYLNLEKMNKAVDTLRLEIEAQNILSTKLLDVPKPRAARKPSVKPPAVILNEPTSEI